MAGKNDLPSLGQLLRPLEIISLTTRGHFLLGFQIPKSSNHPRAGTFLKVDVNLMAYRDAHFERVIQCQAIFPASPRKCEIKLFLVMLLLFSDYVSASCSSISDHDKRSHCQARQEGSSCSSIGDHDLRSACEAEKGSSCSSIGDHDQRAYCEAKKGSSCSSIGDHDQRAACEAEKGSSCSSIGDHDQRAFCETKKGSSCSSIGDHDLRSQCEAMKR